MPKQRKGLVRRATSSTKKKGKSGKQPNKSQPTPRKQNTAATPRCRQLKRRGRKPYFSITEGATLCRIVEKSKQLNKPITRPAYPDVKKKFGRKITHLQCLSDVLAKLGISWQKLQPRSRRQANPSTKKFVEAFVKRERRNACRRQWYVDQIKLPDSEVIGKGYGTPGVGAFVSPNTHANGTGTGIMSCNWEAGMGPFMYVRNEIPQEQVAMI